LGGGKKMTVKEALENIKLSKSEIDRLEWSVQDKREYERDFRFITNEYEILIQRDTAKKPKVFIKHIEIELDDNGVEIAREEHNQYMCGVCNEPIARKRKFCGWCGQRIDWEEKTDDKRADLAVNL